MPVTSPVSVEEQIAWLTNRVQIHDLLLAYARCVDTKDWTGFADLFADDGRVVLPFGSIGKGDMADSVERILAPYEATHHLFANVGIDIDGDTARANHYLQAVHVTSAGTSSRHADIGGWYNNTYRRIPGGWRFVSVDLTLVWSAGDVFEPEDPTG
ncbi:nuclear transport factor 2 family protein [Rhodococcus oxybenzonivorans]|uniref:nuclear transport factor 2 family protein n=1 Tax=Rhodococcus oxybenzonivorans TaxID=1990687 RepID=UPI0029544CA8|nr:nuclear transport factor 2 family protein [Rhodococcus oxybenzonivorans]MDV7353678.1 nuclear transport factor 2 family protein [Rhodococcus oxybenzonivorans]